MATFSGKIIRTDSEAVNNAPVVVDFETADGVQTVAFERRLWNDFFFAHEENIRDDSFRVIVWGEPWQQQIACTSEACEPCYAALND